MSYIDWWRILNACLASVAFMWLMLDLKEIYLKLSKRRLYFTFALALSLFAIVVGSIESIEQGNPPGIRTGLYTVCGIWTLFGLWVSRFDKS